jgi:hypothetical protein
MTGTLHAVQGLLAGAALSVQAQPSGRAATDQDFSRRSAFDVVAGRVLETKVLARWTEK